MMSSTLAKGITPSAENRNMSKTSKGITLALLVLGVAMALYQLVSAQMVVLSYWAHQNAHLGFSLLLIFLAAIKESLGKSRGRLYFFIGSFVLAAICVGYIAIFIDDLEMRAFFNTPLDLVIGTILIVVVLLATWRTFGFILPLLAVIFIAYAFLGQYLTGGLRATAVSPSRLIAQLGIGLSGIFGDLFSISADVIFYFVLFGVLLQVSGATGFFSEVGKIVGRKLRAGPALSSVVTSSLIGMCTGSIAANIATTGSFTIPTMKEAGYSPNQAGAIEAASSAGGQIMPPIMGAAAFVMSGTTGIPYLRIMTAAIIPAILYFFGIALYAQLQAVRLGIKSKPSTSVNVKELLLRMPLFIIPLSVIVYLMVRGRSLMYCSFWAIVACIVLSLLRKETRSSIGVWLEGFARGAAMGAQIAVAVATIGMMISIITLTGLGVKLPGLVEAWSGGNLMVALLIVMVTAIILGMGTATVAVYMLVALVAAPTVVKLGIPLLSAHFFVFFYACFSFLTPPVAVGALIASKMAGGTYIKTSIEAVKASIAGFFLPFLIIWNPVLLLLEPERTTVGVIARLIVSLISLLALQFSLVNYYLTTLNFIERIFLTICFLVVTAYLVTETTSFAIAGICLFSVVTFLQFRVLRKNWALAVTS